MLFAFDRDRHVFVPVEPADRRTCSASPLVLVECPSVCFTQILVNICIRLFVPACLPTCPPNCFLVFKSVCLAVLCLSACLPVYVSYCLFFLLVDGLIGS